MTTDLVGNISEAAVTYRLLKRGDTTLMKPIGGNCRLDLGVLSGDTFLRVQVKTGHLENGTVVFNACSQILDSKGKTHYKDYRGVADYFAVWCEELSTMYWVPVDSVPKSKVYLRIDPPRNNVQKGVRFAKDFVFN